jgi:hypothetical protein
MARSSTETLEGAGAGAPASALDLVGAGAQDGPADPDAARSALDAGAPAELAEQSGALELDQAPGARDRRRAARDRRARKGGHKPTKQELEREVRELRARAEASAPDQVAQMQSQASTLAPALGATFGTVFSMLARRKGAHWKLTDDERAILAEHWAICLAPYMAQAGPYVPWAAAVIVTWSVVEGRVEKDQAAARAGVGVMPAAA